SQSRKMQSGGEQGTQYLVHRLKRGAAMKVIELERARPTLDELMGFAKDELVVLRRPDGSVFALSQVDDFDVETELLKNNPEFMMFLRQLSQEKAATSLLDLRKELGL